MATREPLYEQRKNQWLSNFFKNKEKKKKEETTFLTDLGTCETCETKFIQL